MLDPSYLESIENFERAIKDIHWLVRFDSDSRSMNIPASYGGIDADVYSRFKAKKASYLYRSCFHLDLSVLRLYLLVLFSEGGRIKHLGTWER